jgi:hypothetical protein
LPKLCLEDNNVASSARIVDMGSESTPNLLNQDRRSNLKTLTNLQNWGEMGTD